MKKFWKKHQTTIAVVGVAALGIGGCVVSYYVGRNAGFNNTMNWFEDHIPELQVGYRLKQYFDNLQ